MKSFAGAVLLTMLGMLPGLGLAQADLGLCTLCHGTAARGNPAVRAPRLAGVESWYLQSQLQAYRTGLRGTHPDDVPGNEMRAVAVALGDTAALNGVVKQLAALKPAASPRVVSGDVARGQDLYAGCSACHGARGEGNAILKAPALTGGSDWYQAAQLRSFLQGWRGTHERDASGAQMRAAVSVLPDDQAAIDVVAYINTLGN